MSDGPQTDQVLFLAELDKLVAMMSWVRKWIKKSGLTAREARKVELSMEEALVNVIQHAYKEMKGEIKLECHLWPHQRIEFVIRDTGIPFNPLQQVKKVDTFASLEKRGEGGLGIFFLLQCMDKVQYERQHPYNILILTQKVP